MSFDVAKCMERTPDESKILDALKLTDKISEMRLQQVPTADLVAELKSRHELCPVLDEMDEPVCMFVSTTESLVKELVKRDGVELFSLDEPVEYCNFYAYQYTGGELFKRSVDGPAKILVVID